MCDACEHGREAARAMENALIAQHGFTVRFIAPSDDEPAFAYTVGRAPLKPEFYINSLSPNPSAMLIHSAIEAVEKGEITLSDGLETTALFTNGYRVRFAACDARAAGMAGVVMRNQYYSPESWQIIWPDAQGKLPGEEGFDTEHDQPTYSPDLFRMFVEYDEHGNPCPETAMCSKHVHRGEEFSVERSLTIHAPSDDPTLECQLCGKGLLTQAGD